MMEDQELQVFEKSIKYQNDFIWVKPVCDMLKIDYKYQVEVIRNDPILSGMVEKNSSEMLFGDKRSRILLPKKGFIRWIQIINPTIVNNELRPKLIQFQTMVFDLLYGSLEAEQKAREKYTRLMELRSEYARIGREIQQLDKDLKNYLKHKFQYSLSFDEDKKIENEQ